MNECVRFVCGLCVSLGDVSVNVRLLKEGIRFEFECRRR